MKDMPAPASPRERAFRRTGQIMALACLTLSLVMEAPTIQPARTWRPCLYQGGTSTGPNPRKLPVAEKSMAPTAIEPGNLAFEPAKPPKTAKSRNTAK
jgi:capsular polysaccharide biosynthesis protein